jgi:ubiquinone/menaquinone biosynthesis C-methylase UbiE
MALLHPIKSCVVALPFGREVGRFLLPRITTTRRIGNVTDDVPPEDSLHTSTLWWEQDLYTKIPRKRHFEWLGLKVPISATYSTIKGSYFKSADDLLAVISSMEGNGLIPSLSKQSRVLEPGSSIGRNLRALWKRYGCEVVGLDISEQAVSLAREQVWKGIDKADFQVANVLTTDFFDTIADNHFDLCITRWHLVCLPKSPEKTRYLEQLKRVSKSLVFFEPSGNERKGTIEYSHNGQYCLSFDDWAEDYGLIEFEVAPLEWSTNVYYYADPLKTE